VLLFGFQGDAIIRLPLVIAMLAVPVLIQFNFCSPDLVVSMIIDPNQ